MFKKLPWLLIIIVMITSADIQAQKTSSKKKRSKSHRTESRFDWDWNWRWDNYSRPIIELNYGMSKPEHKKFGSSFSDVGLAEIKLGFSSIDDYYEEYIVDFDENFFFASNISTDLRSANDDASTLDSDLWRFGFGWRDGYGYALGAAAIIPYTQYSITWSKLDMKEYPPAYKAEDVNILNRFNDSFRFGTSAEAGVKFEFDSFISLNAAYEVNAIFPRHLFWKHTASASLELIGLSTIDYFVDEIIDSSPAAGPVLNALLKSGYMYAFHHLKKDKMNWPFDSEAPLTYDTFKIGATFIF